MGKLPFWGFRPILQWTLSQPLCSLGSTWLAPLPLPSCFVSTKPRQNSTMFLLAGLQGYSYLQYAEVVLAQMLAQLNTEYLQGWRFLNLFGQPVPIFSYCHYEIFCRIFFLVFLQNFDCGNLGLLTLFLLLERIWLHLLCTLQLGSWIQ